jgi:hypothetical protein
MSDAEMTHAAPWVGMDKKAKQQHLREGHGMYAEARWTVEQLDQIHDRSHDEAGQVAAGIVPERYAKQNRHPAWTVQALKANYVGLDLHHDHVQEPVSEEERAMVEKIRQGLPLDKPLPAGERKVLSTLVDNDFATLANEMRQMAADTREARLKEVRDEWAGKNDEGPRYVAEIQRIHEEAHKAIQDLRGQAEANGITLMTGSRYEYPTITVQHEVTGLRDG